MAFPKGSGAAVIRHRRCRSAAPVGVSRRAGFRDPVFSYLILSFSYSFHKFHSKRGPQWAPAAAAVTLPAASRAASVLGIHGVYNNALSGIVKRVGENEWGSYLTNEVISAKICTTGMLPLG